MGTCGSIFLNIQTLIATPWYTLSPFGNANMTLILYQCIQVVTGVVYLHSHKMVRRTRLWGFVPTDKHTTLHQVHGDIKAVCTSLFPFSFNFSQRNYQANILVSQDGVAKLSDFDHSIMSECSLVFSETSKLGGGTTRWMVSTVMCAPVSFSPSNTTGAGTYT